jgi:type I restriction enzyme S subunit
LERARQACEARLEAARALYTAYLREVFESEEVRRWSIKKIGDLARVQSGYAFKSTWFAADGIRLLRNANVFQGHIDWSDSVHLPAERRHEFSIYELSAGDIVLSLDRLIVRAGLKIARLTRIDVPALLLQRVGRFVLTEAVDPEYLYSFLNSSRFVEAITGHDYSIGVPHISPGQVEAVEISCPPLPAQRYIAANLQEMAKTINEQLLLPLIGERDALHEVPASLLRQAFSGAL